jgi:uncharacterized membrane protein YfcA
MFHEVISVLLGAFSGFYGSFIGTSGGAALMIYLLMVLNIVSDNSTLIGTLLLISSVPLGLFGLYEYNKQGKVNYYIGAFLVLGVAFGAFMGAKYAFVLDKVMGVEFSTKFKAILTGAVYSILSITYFYKGFHKK